MKCLLLTGLPNRHLAAVLQEAADLGGWKCDVCYYSDLPDHRKSLGWIIPKDYSKVAWGLSAAKLPRLLNHYDRVIFLGIAEPRIWQLLSAAIAVWKKKQLIIAAEGRKPVEKVTVLKRMKDSISKVALSTINCDCVSFFAIGDRSAEDYRNLGLLRPTYYRFGFTEPSPPVVEQPKQENRITLLSIGQLIPRKNHVAVCRALQAYRGEADVDYVICGGGSEESRLKLEAERLPSNCQLTLAGPCSDSQLGNWLSLADIFVMPSIYDGWGVALNHAIQAGLPAIVSRSTRAGAGHLVDDGVNGFCYASEKELRDRLFQLMGDETLRKRMSLKSLERASLWSFGEIAKRINRFISDEEVAHDNEGPLVKLVF